MSLCSTKLSLPLVLLQCYVEVESVVAFVERDSDVSVFALGILDPQDEVAAAVHSCCIALNGETD